jgi:hypothetical protein
MGIVFVVDIDGTVCDSKERMAEIIGKYGEEEDWTQQTIDEFLTPGKLMMDKVMLGAEKLFDLAKLCRGSIVFLTGRNECARLLTRKWLSEVLGAPDDVPLVMRPLHWQNGHTADCKEEMFRLKVLPSYPNSTFIFFEDDKNTILKYAKYGLVLKSPACWECIG